MNEDLKPIYDFEKDWECVNPPKRGGKKQSVIIFNNKVHKSLYRIVDIANQTITFSDVARVQAIKDIDKILTKSDDEDENKKRFLSLANMILDGIKPISMPYVPEHLTCFIENFPGFDKNYPDTVGILYFREEKEDGNMLQAKKFFKINPVGASSARFEEISLETYNQVKSDFCERCEKDESKKKEGN
ncbi:hypothetical protein [Butyrivibrio sp. INlla21]|uniref:hypothetical protein n=1 Tax=Butyrivibrio sp. INlla21 TaxID=1520811 RepID=UPI0008E577D3|nr:hypothetical protein [Butyrivibrio sp. INlla21]SFU32621.1 hypothetical protein SAMN02910342_00084 [Butyrivibrio sp. INlla21]